LVAGDGAYGGSREHKFRVPTTDEYPTRVPLSPTASPAPSKFTVLVLLQLVFDDWHAEVSWKITDDDDENIVYAEAPPGSYRFGDSVTEEVQLPPGGSYMFAIQDTAGDGIFVDGVAYSISLEDSAGELITLLQGDGNFFEERTSRFIVPSATRYACNNGPFCGTSGVSALTLPSVMPSNSPTETPLSCKGIFQECVSNSECCSVRCMSPGVCRTSASGGSKTSVGRQNGARGGAGGRGPRRG
jgi:hypothetical protein